MTTAVSQQVFRAFELELGLDEDETGLRERIAERFGIEVEHVRGLRIARKALDARRRRAHLGFVLNVDFRVDGPHSKRLRRALRSGRVARVAPLFDLGRVSPHPSLGGTHVAIIGAGPAGLFAALLLARSGVRVTVIERGPPVEERARPLVAFHRTREPNHEANLLFGEGGAGTYSDGKIYTRVDDPLEPALLDELIACGAPPAIAYDSRAHIGTDKLHRILPRFRGRLESLGVRFLWNTRAEDLAFGPEVGDGAGRRIRAVITTSGSVDCDALFVAPGHSARDTWRWLHARGLVLEGKPFQLGLRIEHPQALIDAGRFGSSEAVSKLGSAYYGLTCKAGDGLQAVHTFCMCPGGRIVASVNEPGLLCTNGMSNSKHSSGWASAALVSTIGPAEFGSGVFDGVEFQEGLERRFFQAGGADFTAPAQAASDYLRGRLSPTTRHSTYTFGTVPARLDQLLPEPTSRAIGRALELFERSLPGFAGQEGEFVGLESRCSSPLRATRHRETRLALGFANLYPIGEGAGYAGGIMSSALDGARSALLVVERGVVPAPSHPRGRTDP